MEHEKITEFMKTFEDYKPNGRILKKAKEAAEEERTRQLRKLEKSRDVPFGYKIEDGDVKVDPHQATYLRLSTELHLLGLRDSEIMTIFREMSIPRLAKEGYDINDHCDSVIKRGKELLQERLSEEGNVQE